MPKPSDTKRSSCALACTNTTSASPRRAVSSAWPVPWAITFTSMPVLALNSGRMWPNRPESCVDVVEATTIDLSCANAGVHSAAANVSASTTRRFIFCSSFLDHEIAAQERGGLCCFRRVEECRSLGALDQPSTRQENNVARKPARLPEFVCRHHDLHPGGRDTRDDVFDGFRRGGIEARGRLVEKQN